MCYFSPTLLFPISFTFLRLKDLLQISKWSPVFEFPELLELIWIFLIVKMYFKKTPFQSGSKIARKFRIFHTKLGPHRLKKAWKISGKINFLPFNSRKTSRKQLIPTSMKILNSRNLWSVTLQYVDFENVLQHSSLTVLFGMNSLIALSTVRN